MTNRIRIKTISLNSRYLPAVVFVAVLFILTALLLFELLILRTFEFPSLLKSLSLWFVLLLPFAAAIITFFLQKEIYRRDKFHIETIRQKEQIIKKYTDLASRLGRGEYSVPVAPEGEEDKLGQTLQMLQGFLKANQRKETDQNWISEGKELISRVLRINNRMDDLAFHTLKNLCDYLKVQQAAFYLYDEEEKLLTCIASYAYNRKKYLNQVYKLGEGLVGECAYEMDYVYRTEIPGEYLTITSGILGDLKPVSILLIPLITDEKLQGVIEFASLHPKFPKISIQFLLELGEIIARTVYNLRINKRTEDLLEESKKITFELRESERALQENASLMQKTQEELKKTNLQLESKIREVENTQGKLYWLMQNASEVIAIYNREIRMTYISPSVLKILGYSQEEMMQGKDFERLTHEGAAELRKLISESAENPGLTRTIQYTFITREGDRIFLESVARNLLDDPAIGGIVLNTRDITEKIRAEKEERLKSRMQSLSENSLDMIIRLSVSGQFYYANPVVEDYLGIQPSGIINKNISELDFVRVLKSFLTENIASVVENPLKKNSEVAVPVKMGEKLTERILNLDVIPEFNQGELETILFVGHDITEAKRIEKEIQIKNKNIGDSINYAQKIQSALLPDIASIKEVLPKSFVFYQPRDVISGDFPWFYKSTDAIYIAAVDCTGHGVPGALLSFIGFFLMKEVIQTAGNKNAGQICDLIHSNFRETLKQNDARADSRDSMDLALCKIMPGNKLIEYAGAHRPLYLLRDGELTEYKGDRKSIGGIPLLKKTEEPFTNVQIQFNPGDKIFFHTDGLTDQLGGPYGRKYSPNRLRDRILENSKLSIQGFHSLFESDFAEWQKGFKQLDDVLMIGIEF